MLRSVRNLLSGISFLVAGFFLLMTIYFIIDEDALGGLGVGVTMLIIFLILGIALKTKAQTKTKHEELVEEPKVVQRSAAHHIEGLKLSEKTRCDFALYEDRLEIEGGGVTHNLALSQITAAEIKTDVEIANIVHSSAVKGIVGGLVFGPIGLVVGARATNKEKRTPQQYFVINYINSQGEISYILFKDDIIPHVTKKLESAIGLKVTSNEQKLVQL